MTHKEVKIPSRTSLARWRPSQLERKRNRNPKRKRTTLRTLTWSCWSSRNPLHQHLRSHETRARWFPPMRIDARQLARRRMIRATMKETIRESKRTKMIFLMRQTILAKMNIPAGRIIPNRTKPNPETTLMTSKMIPTGLMSMAAPAKKSN